MKSALVIGMGRFGRYLSIRLAELGNDVMIADIDEERVNDLLPYVSNAQIGDCTKEEVLRSIGVRNFDIVFVCIGENFQSSLEITSLAKDLGAQMVISKANREIDAKFLLRNGADEIVYAEKNMAEKVAARYNADNVFDIIEMTDDYFIYEIPTLEDWYGKTIAEVNCRARYNINILATKVGDKMMPMPGPEHVFSEFEHLMVLGHQKDLKRLLK